MYSTPLSPFGLHSSLDLDGSSDRDFKKLKLPAMGFEDVYKHDAYKFNLTPESFDGTYERNVSRRSLSSEATSRSLYLLQKENEGALEHDVDDSVIPPGGLKGTFEHDVPKGLELLPKGFNISLIQVRELGSVSFLRLTSRSATARSSTTESHRIGYDIRGEGGVRTKNGGGEMRSRKAKHGSFSGLHVVDTPCRRTTKIY